MKKSIHASSQNTISAVSILQTLTEEVFFPKGLVGFQEYQEFFLHHYGEDTYLVLEAKEDPSLRFLLHALSWDFYPSKDLADSISAENIEEIDEQIYAIICYHPENPTLNLRAPLIKQDEKMWQIILHEKYPLDYPLE